MKVETTTGYQAPRLIDVPMVGVYPVSIHEANLLLEAWKHRLGPVRRPFRQEAYVLDVGGKPVALATSGSIVNGPVAGYERGEVVELTRLCSAPAASAFTRVMLRLWREICAPAWKSWSVRAAVSYSQNAHYRGDIYRFDGWDKVADDCGSTGGGAWKRKRYASDAAHGKKTLWVWRYET